MATQQTFILSIIIVSYNTADLTIQTLQSVKQSLQRSTYLKNQTEIFVVDNNSHDDSVTQIKKLQKEFSHLHLIENTKNTGFAQANNQAAEQAQGKYLLLLNSDTIVQNNALELLVKQTEAEELDITAARLLNSDFTHQAQGGHLPTLVTLFNHFFFIDDLPVIGKYIPSTQSTGHNFRADTATDTTNEITPMGWVGGTAMLISQKFWHTIGKLDEDIFMYGEDMELCLRAHLQGGKIGIVNTAQIIHLGSASSSSKNALIGEIKGYLYIWKKHKPTWQLAFLKVILRGGIILRIVLFTWILQDQRGKIYKEALRYV